jgi:hypothetical protein
MKNDSVFYWCLRIPIMLTADAMLLVSVYITQ